MRYRIYRLIAVSAAIAAIVGTPIAYVSYKQERCSDLFANARLAFDNRNWRFASVSLENYLACDPANQHALHMCIESHYQSMNFVRARYWIDHDQQLYPGDPVPNYWQAVLSILEHNDFESALPILEEVHFEVEETHPQVNMFLGMALIKTGHTEEGCASLEYYIDTPQKPNSIRREAAQLYNDICVET